MNISSIKTPGVYINEIDAFPQSVASVATAIPAFIGYTETAPSPNVPTRIVSMLEYNQYFGGAPEPANVTIELDANNIPTDATTVEESKYKLYNSLQLFYTNGGGECYIVSIGNYNDAIAKNDFTGGIEALESFDEPTLILFPDGVSLDSVADLGNVQQAALAQCQLLMDRFVIMDVKQSDETNATLTTDIAEFRDAIGTQSLKYGAAYYPHLVTNFENQYNFLTLNTALAPQGFKRFSPGDTALNTAIDTYVTVDGLINGYETVWNALTKTIDGTIPSNTVLKSNLIKVWAQLKVVGKPDAITDAPDFKAQLNQVVSISLLQYAKNLADFKLEYESLKKPDGSGVDPIGTLTGISSSDFNGNWGSSAVTTGNTTNSFLNKLSNLVGENKVVDFVKIQAELSKLNKEVISALESTFSSFNVYQSYQESVLTAQIPMYAVIVAKLNQSLNTTPPSGALAGIYAQTDANRGVWKAPANIGISGIIGLTDDITDREQEPMNISDTGKSVNAIRKFTGQGFVVWGGRTLNGNSNDWRYINVRRLANMIEESVKKACNHYVFEPNTAQTWVSVKGMIENYLTTLWTDGGLAGAKPSQAFFVAIGLNQTMTAQDINEGRMIVKVGYAPSRPAEFIIVEFKQMLQQS
jgi:uncharacterized protein